jgi:hypothetical protein
MTTAQAPRIDSIPLRHGHFGEIERLVGEFWTARQRQMHSLHYVISYRASFKPELPDFFISRYSEPGDIILDPFSGRGTTPLQAALMERYAVSVDANPLSERIVWPKLHPVSIAHVEQRLGEINFAADESSDIDLLMFYHEETLRQILCLRHFLFKHDKPVDRFIELIALSRLHGHSPGFFSVYSFPQISVPAEGQRRINQRRNQRPDYRDVPDLILRKARKTLRDGELERIRKYGSASRLFTSDARHIREIDSDSIDLIVTSPPFLNKANYLQDNWLEFWFCGIDPEPLANTIVMTGNLGQWKDFLRNCMREMHRVLKPGCYAAIEVGEVTNGDGLVFLDEVLVDIAAQLHAEGVSLVPERIYIHQQNFTKLANCFNVENNRKGTNTNRIVVFRAE